MWVKEGATGDDLKRDQSECEQKARADAVFYNPQPLRGAGRLSGVQPTDTMKRESQAFWLCMKSRGYAETPDK
jgi:hypothetical protein